MKTLFNSQIFSQALKNLNTEQKEAVDSIEGPVMVIAGPGTGKTQILTLRIANILQKTDTRPEQILALTFTDSGVRAMRNRLASFIGADAYHVPIHTFHSFAGELIRRYPDSYKNIVGGRPASDLEKITIIEELLEEGVYRRLRPHGDHGFYVKPILDAIGTLKKENISPDKFAAYIIQQERGLDDIQKIHEKGAHKGKLRGEYIEAEKFLERNQELLHVYQLYIAILKDRRLYDFEDMILDTITALENNQEMLFDVQEQYQYILADEHQDVNQSQNRLIELIASYHESPNVFVVGDEKQAIYRFQGASLDNFLYFGDIYKNAKIIALTNNYRSDQRILDVAHECIVTEDLRLKDLRVPLKAQKEFDVTLTQQSFSHIAIEDDWVITQLQKYHETGVAWDEMAIIVRTNREVENFANLLRKMGVPVSPSADGDILQHPITNSILNLLKTITDPTDESSLAEILHAPYLNISSIDLVSLLSARSYKQRLIDILSDEERLKEVGVQNFKSFTKLTSIIDEAKRLELVSSPTQLVEHILRESGFIEYVLAQDTFESVRVVRRLYDEIELMFSKGEVKNIREILEQFTRRIKYNLPLNAPYIQTTSDAVQVMTAHKAKGLEYEVVLIPHLTDNTWGASQRSSLFQLPIVKHEVDDMRSLIEDDERRLFYVAITRAKRVLLCSSSAMNNEGRDLSPSRFLVALDTNKITLETTTTFEGKFAPLENLKIIPTYTLNSDFLRTTLEKRGWSATSFNNYCKSPWEYIYKNALRIPTIKSPELQFGTTVHSVLEKISNYIHEDGKSPTETEISNWLDIALATSSLTVQEFTRQHERAFAALLAYLPRLEQTIGKNIKTEYSLKVAIETGIPDFPEVILTGNFDRLDLDEEGKVIRVLDYKTGKTKTRGEIEGTTKTSDGGYKRQLTFYALLLSLHSDERFHTKNGVLSFVEPDSKGVIHEESFTITEAEIEELRTQILKATREVVSGECLETECDTNKCDYCHLVELLEK